ncbi:MAG: CPBP family intramembrane metalloprotease [Lachnospiraceae bacterium]|nr:CPBP family intramembrane metalloprotease [Lachnospiraceae bacterium]
MAENNEKNIVSEEDDEVKITEPKNYLYNIAGSFFIVWLLWLIKVYAFDGIIKTMGLWPQSIINSFFKCIVLIPIPFYLIKNKKVWISWKEMIHNKINIKTFGILFAFVVFKFFLELMNSGFSESFHVSKLLVSFLLVGITEELLFRGWIYNALLITVSDTLAIILQGLMFVMLHLPGYIYAGTVFSGAALSNYVVYFVLGVAFAWAFKKDKSIWTPIAIHMLWDLAMLLVM